MAESAGRGGPEPAGRLDEYEAAPGAPAPKRGVTRPIIGGTGSYAHATGTVTQKPIAGGELTNVLNIRTPKD